MTEHRTRYARSGEINIAYQVIGDGPRDIVYVPGAVSHLDLRWEEPMCARFFNLCSAKTFVSALNPV
ncbi:MAG: hypothetical protein WCA22_19675 [Candidatus Binatus sp.]